MENINGGNVKDYFNNILFNENPNNNPVDSSFLWLGLEYVISDM